MTDEKYAAAKALEAILLLLASSNCDGHEGIYRLLQPHVKVLINE